MSNNTEGNPEEVKTSQKKESPHPTESLREWVGLFATGAGIFAAFFYLAGRRFFAGYFSAMNIPSNNVSFSLWEYAEAGWIPLLLFPSYMLMIMSFIVGCIYLLIENRRKRTAWHMPEMTRAAGKAFSISGFSLMFLLLSFAVISSLNFVRSWGEASGQDHVVEEAAQLELVSSSPLALDNDNLLSTKASGKDFYIYKGFHLLVVNNGRYYLFKTIDPVTCKPVKVYVIELQESLQVNLLPATSLKDQCGEAAFKEPVAVPVWTATPGQEPTLIPPYTITPQ